MSVYNNALIAKSQGGGAKSGSFVKYEISLCVKQFRSLSS